MSKRALSCSLIAVASLGVGSWTIISGQSTSAPPLVITRAQIDEMMALIRRCLDLTWKDVKTQGWA